MSCPVVPAMPILNISGRYLGPTGYRCCGPISVTLGGTLVFLLDIYSTGSDGAFGFVAATWERKAYVLYEDEPHYFSWWINFLWIVYRRLDI